MESIGVEFFQARSQTLFTRVGKLEWLLPPILPPLAPHLRNATAGYTMTFDPCVPHAVTSYP